MLVQNSQLVFSSSHHKRAIAFRDILKLSKEASHFGLSSKGDSIKIKTKSDEFFFSNIKQRDDVYDLLSQLWNIDMEKRYA